MPLKISLDPQAEISLSQQFYLELRRLILAGKLQPGERLPSSRELAEHLDVSRPTISAGVRQLTAEGYLESRHGSGCYVSENIERAQAQVKTGKPAATPRRRTKLASAPISDYGQFLQELPEQEPPPPFKISFYCWRPALDQFPLTDWSRLLGRQMREGALDMLDSGDPCGELGLRTAVAELVKRYRGIECGAEQVVLVMGLSQGLDIVSRLHLGAESLAVVEDPSYPGAADAFRGCHADVEAVAVDEEGLCVSSLPRRKSPGNCLVYVTPSCQFPTGAVMPLSRRLSLLAWARKNEAIILEDDYDSEYHESGRPIPALASLDKSGSVIYLGTLNQSMFPSLGLGYLIVPPQLVSLYGKARRLAGEQLPLHLQNAVAEFIETGQLDRHMRRLRTLYKERRNTLLNALKKSLDSRVTIKRERAGVFVIINVKSRFSTDEILKRAAQAELGLTSTRDFYSGKAPQNEFILGFGSLNERQIREGVRRLAYIIQ